MPKQSGWETTWYTSIALRALLLFALLSLLLEALAVAGLFRPLPIVLTTLAAVAVAVALHRMTGSARPQEKAAAGDTWAVLALAGVLIATAAVLWPPAQFVLGGLDPGAYFNAGALLAQEGGFATKDALLAAAPEARSALTLSLPGSHGHLQPGFYWNNASSEVSVQFPFLLTLWTGLSMLTAGSTGALAVPAAGGLMALVYFYLFGRRLLSPWPAVLAVGLVASSGVFLWHSRSHYSEPLLLALLFGGLWAGLRWQEDRDTLAAATAGLCLGLLPLVKTEALLLGPLAAVGLLALSFSSAERRGVAFFLAGYVPPSVLALLVYATLASPVLADQAPRAWGYPLVAVAAAATILAARWGLSRLATVRTTAPITGGVLVLLAGAGCVALASGAPSRPSLLQALWDGLYLSPLDGALLAIALLAFLHTRPQPPSTVQQVVLLALLAAAVVYLALFYRYTLTADQRPLHMWADRRLLPVVIPLLALAQAWVVSRLLTRTRSWGRAVLSVCVIALLLAARVPDLAPLLSTREYTGALAAVETIAAQTEPDAIILADSDANGIRFAAPLRFIADRATYLNYGQGEPLPLEALSQHGQRPLYYLSSALTDPTAVLSAASHEELARWRFDLPELERTSQHRPQWGGIYRAELTLYRLEPAE